MPNVNEENFEPILQWRKLSGDSPSKKCTPWQYSTQKNESLKQSSIRHGKTKVLKQDSVNEGAKIRGKQRNDTTKKDHVANSGNTRKLHIHIVQNKKAQFSHLISQQKVMPKDEDQCPIVYNSSEVELRKEVAALWLQPFTVVDDY